ncbi:hypothetical protein JBKA6_1461 [Ichthyobacterium seriolicida]|uniref:Uncharacterized protein n=1 Tax=Ichthyobacterium seriolicida TaxID=242600 RepID=A0A1J1DZW8_9FLAO|nr:hypothetical protein JBKA6_1461 [Ichthyobacterium seriolicida]
MVAQIAPHFVGEKIPAYGKDNLSFYKHIRYAALLWDI